MLFCTSLVAIVGIGDQPNSSPRRLKIINTKRKLNICELTFPTAVLKVKLNRKRLVVLLEEQIYIYDITNMQLLHTIETSPNPNAICALSSDEKNCFLAYPSPVPQSTLSFSGNSNGHSVPSASSDLSRNGDVVIFDTIALAPINIIEAHKSPLSALAFNFDGTLLATASDKGTIVRVFSIPSTTKLYQFRRGTYPARIFSLNFNNNSTLLAVSSATETVHVFKLAKSGQVLNPSRTSIGNSSSPTNSASSADADEDSDGSILPTLNSSASSGANAGSTAGLDAFIEAKRRNGTVASLLRRGSLNLSRQVAGAMGNYLPAKVTEMWEPQRDFAYIKLAGGAQGGNGGHGGGGAAGGMGGNSAGKSGPVKTIVSFNRSSSHVLVVTSDGYFCQYLLDLERGGECELLQQYSLLSD